jgi:superfamily I DNA and/or RNA helicase
VFLLKSIIHARLNELGLQNNAIEINTVDAYQGREKDIIIISCVRSSEEKSIGFLNDYRRMNVAITRAKHFLWVVGNKRTLERNKNWRDFIDYSKSLDKEKSGVKHYFDINGEEEKELEITRKEKESVR